MSRDGLCSFKGSRIITVTNAGGVKVYVGGDVGREVWFAQGHIHDNSEIWRAGQEGELVVSEWVALKKGLV
jgi:hypothetical protein